jgi:hypothetical protein
MAIKYANIFPSKALKHFPKLEFFWFENKPSGNPGLGTTTPITQQLFQSQKTKVPIFSNFFSPEISFSLKRVRMGAERRKEK